MVTSCLFLRVVLGLRLEGLFFIARAKLYGVDLMGMIRIVFAAKIYFLNLWNYLFIFIDREIDLWSIQYIESTHFNDEVNRVVIALAKVKVSKWKLKRLFYFHRLLINLSGNIMSANRRFGKRFGMDPNFGKLKTVKLKMKIYILLYVNQTRADIW